MFKGTTEIISEVKKTISEENNFFFFRQQMADALNYASLSRKTILNRTLATAPWENSLPMVAAVKMLKNT